MWHWRSSQRWYESSIVSSFRITLVFWMIFFLLPYSAVSQGFLFSNGGGTVSLTIDSATAGFEPDNESDNFTELSWDADYGVTSKITVTTSCPSQNFSLFAELNITTFGSGSVGSEQGEIELIDGMFDTDMVLNIPPSQPGRVGSGTITYRASAGVADGNSTEHGDDLHTVTFTLTAQ